MCIQKYMVGRVGFEPTTNWLKANCSTTELTTQKMVGVGGFELPTSCSQSRRATGLRYTPMAPRPGLEPGTQ